MPVPNGIAAATLTGNGYTLSNGVYSQTFGTITVNITLSTEVEGGGFAASVNVLPNADISAADAASVAANMVKIGLTQFATWPNTSLMFTGAQSATGYGLQPGYWQTV